MIDFIRDGIAAKYAFVAAGYSWQRGPAVTQSPQNPSMIETTMWTLADRVVKAVSDATVGTVIVLVHIALADRSRKALAETKRQPQRLPS